MTPLFENPIPIYAVSAVALTVGVLLFFNRRDLPSLVAMVTIMLFAISIIVLERLVVTDREQVGSNIESMMLAIEQNDVQGVLALVDPAAAEVRSDIETMLPMVQIRDTGVTSLQVDAVGQGDPPATTASFRGKVDLQFKEFRYMYFDRVELDWVKRGERWLLQGYQPYNDGKPIDARRSIQSKKFVPASGGN